MPLLPPSDKNLTFNIVLMKIPVLLDMKKYRIFASFQSINYFDIIDCDDDVTDEELEEISHEFALSRLSYGYEEIPC
jgi:hypothetical protein